jgi:hypothetical protein
MDPKAKPVKQPLRWFDEPKRKAIASELHRLENIGFNREKSKHQHGCLTQSSSQRKTRTYKGYALIYTSLNKHCPKDPFRLPRVNQIIDSTVGCARLSFFDAYFGYNQIKLKKEDEEKIAFITPYGVFCYQVMRFGLKNAGATYQRMMQNCLESQIGHNIQVYIDDVVITTIKEESLISDLAETFDNLNRYKLKLNPTKCSFGMSAGQLLGFLVSARGIEANPEKHPSNNNDGEINKTTQRIEARGTHRGTKSIHRSIGRKSTSFLCTHEKIR